MDVREIVDELKAGKAVTVLADDAFVFMREVKRHDIATEAIIMTFENSQCVMRISSDKYAVKGCKGDG